jgi:hypothetical protein
MEHIIQSKPVIITEAHHPPKYPGLIRKRKHVNILVLLVLFACFKSEAVEAQPPRVMALAQDGLQMDASRRTARLQYKLNREKTKETGIFLSADSAALISPGQAIPYQAASYNVAGRAFQADFESLEPASRYYYRIFSRDQQNKITWFEITAICTPGFNIRWTGVQKWITASNTTEIMLTGESVDTASGYYQVFLGGKPCELLRITNSPSSVHSNFVIRLPRNAPPGIHRLVMMYKQKRYSRKK